MKEIPTMFKELVPVLRQRAVLLTITSLEDDQIRVNIVPKKLKDGENKALTTPISITATAEELDAGLSSTLVGYVGSHLQLKNTLEKAQAEMDAAAKTAQAEARAKAKTPAKKDQLKAENVKSAVTAKPIEIAKPEPPKTAGLFDAPASTLEVSAAEIDSDEEAEILAEADASGHTDDDEFEDVA